ncbi:MAG: DUF3987 domain-containing protein, partial [Ghiorsea sp.]
DSVMGWSNEPLTSEQRQAYKEKATALNTESERQKREEQTKAAADCVELWNNANDAKDNHAYLEAKHIKSYGIKQRDECLIVPVRINGDVISVQYIKPNGGKWFAKGGRVDGGYHSILGDENADTSRIVIVEGYGTGASVREFMGCHVAVAFNAGNLGKVAQAIRAKLPDAQIIMAADNDNKTSVNIGYDKSVATALLVGGVVALVEGKDGCNVDWNDYHQQHGNAATAKDFEAAIGSLKLEDTDTSTDTLKSDQRKTAPIENDAPKCGETDTTPQNNGAHSEVVGGWKEPEPLPKELAPVLPFDSGAMLPEAFAVYVDDVAERLQCPPEFVACMLVASLSGVIGKSCTIKPKQRDSWKVVPNLWAAIIGRPSAMKSPAMSAAQVGLTALVKNAMEEHKEKLHQFELSKLVYDAEHANTKKDIQARIKKGADVDSVRLPAKPEPVKEKRYSTNAGSVECLIKLLEQNPNGMIQSRDELTGWLRSMDNTNTQDARAFYLEAWDGNSDGFSYDTIGHGHLHCESLCLAVMGTIQPSPLAEIVASADKGAASDDGLLQRFQLMVYPDGATNWSYQDRHPNQEASDSIKSIFSFLDGVEGDFRFKEGDAQNLFVDWYSDLMKGNQNEATPSLESHFSKYPSLLPSLALLSHLVDYAVAEGCEEKGEVIPREIEADQVAKSIAFVQYLKSHARRIYAMGRFEGVDAANKVISKLLNGQLSNP